MILQLLVFPTRVSAVTYFAELGYAKCLGPSNLISFPQTAKMLPFVDPAPHVAVSLFTTN